MLPVSVDFYHVAETVPPHVGVFSLVALAFVLGCCIWLGRVGRFNRTVGFPLVGLAAVCGFFGAFVGDLPWVLIILFASFAAQNVIERRWPKPTSPAQ